jgi:hypothetical protein
MQQIVRIETMGTFEQCSDLATATQWASSQDIIGRNEEHTMQLRLPWLRERLPLAALAGRVTMVLLAAFALVHRLRMGNWPADQWEALGLALSWVSLSYLVGRYSQESLRNLWWKPWRSHTLLVIALLLTGIQMHNWTFKVITAQTHFRGLLIPFAIMAATSSLAEQFFLKLKLLKQAKPWLIVATPYERETFQNGLTIDQDNQSHKQSLTKLCDIQTLSEPLASRPVAGVAISKKILHHQDPIESLIAAQQKGLKYCSAETWCEQTLQRLPPELFKTAGILVVGGYQLLTEATGWRFKSLAICH